jgi:hypothetical protein
VPLIYGRGPGPLEALLHIITGLPLGIHLEVFRIKEKMNRLKLLEVFLRNVVEDGRPQHRKAFRRKEVIQLFLSPIERASFHVAHEFIST